VQRIAYLGPAGTFTEAATRTLVDPDAVELVPAATPPAAMELVRQGRVDAACVPIESSVEGPVPTTIDALATGTRLQIVAEAVLPVRFSVLVRPGTTVVRTVHTHPHAAAQVQQWLAAELGEAVLTLTSSTAAAAEDVAAGRADAAVSTALVGERLGLVALAVDVADVRDAETRFVLLTAPCTPPEPTGHDRTSVVLQLANTPGALVTAMAELALRGIDLTRIESRPTRTGLGTYRFFLDCTGHVADPLVAEALAALHRRCEDVRFLGSWPTASPDAGTVPPDPAGSRGWVTGLGQGRG
jgi:prephenate dehydratase